jgi:hypothetical protein
MSINRKLSNDRIHRAARRQSTMKEPEYLKGAQPPLASNELLGSPLIEPRNAIFYHTQEPRNARDPRCAETRQQPCAERYRFIQAALSKQFVKRPNVRVDAAARRQSTMKEPEYLKGAQPPLASNDVLCHANADTLERNSSFRV